MAKNQDKTLGILVHVLGIFTSFIGALIIYLVAKDNYTKNQAGEALNWQISLIIYYVISVVLAIILIGFLLMVILGIMNLIVCILASVKAANGEKFEYPLTIRFIK